MESNPRQSQQNLFVMARTHILQVLLLILFSQHTLNAQEKSKESNSGTKRFTIENCVNSFDPSKVDSTKVGYQYWFVDRYFVDGRTLKMSAVGPHMATHSPHIHPQDEFFFVLEGTAEFYLDGETTTGGPYTSFYCPSGIKHGIRNAGDTELKYLVIEKYGHNRELTGDGAWCWFSDPRAIYHHTDAGTQVVTGWVKKDGTIEAGALDMSNGKVNTTVLWDQLEKDDHDNPAFVEVADGSILVHYTQHGARTYYQHRTNTRGDITSFSKAAVMDIIDPGLLKQFPRNSVTYANPFQLTKENNRIYSFGRWTGYKPNMMWSDDGGKSWSKAKVVITNVPFSEDNRPYVKYFSDGQSRIHLVFTDGHPRNEPTNSIYYAYYEAGNFYRVDGSKICSVNQLPFQPQQASVVYKAPENQGKAWVFDIVATADGAPVIAYARYPTDSDHRYHYTIYHDGKWVDHEICGAGKWFPQTPEGTTEREPNYSGGLTIHPGKPNIVYLSRSINGVFEIEKRVTDDFGATWDIFPITRGSSQDNVRPFVPRNYQPGDKDVVLWMRNERYLHYTDFAASIQYFIDN